MPPFSAWLAWARAKRLFRRAGTRAAVHSRLPPTPSPRRSSCSTGRLASSPLGAQAEARLVALLASRRRSWGVARTLRPRPSRRLRGLRCRTGAGRGLDRRHDPGQRSRSTPPTPCPLSISVRLTPPLAGTKTAFLRSRGPPAFHSPEFILRTDDCSDWSRRRTPSIRRCTGPSSRPAA